jgi:hypothetical protein
MGQCTGELVGTAWVIRLEGWFISDQDAVLIQEAMANHPAEARCVVVNWSGILHINSTSLGAVMRGELDVTNQGLQYRNCAYSERASRIVSIFRKKFPWNYFETEAEAVQACSPTDADDARAH